MLGPFTTASRITAIHQMSLAVLSCAACASMSTTTPTTTTTTRDRGDRYGPMEWAQQTQKQKNWVSISKDNGKVFKCAGVTKNWPANSTKWGEDLRWSHECEWVRRARLSTAVSALSAPTPSQLCAPCLRMHTHMHTHTHTMCFNNHLLCFELNVCNKSAYCCIFLLYESVLFLKIMI